MPSFEQVQKFIHSINVCGTWFGVCVMSSFVVLLVIGIFLSACWNARRALYQRCCGDANTAGVYQEMEDVAPLQLQPDATEYDGEPVQEAV